MVLIAQMSSVRMQGRGDASQALTPYDNESGIRSEFLSASNGPLYTNQYRSYPSFALNVAFPLE